VLNSGWWTWIEPGATTHRLFEVRVSSAAATLLSGLRKGHSRAADLESDLIATPQGIPALPEFWKTRTLR
jgi:hypothetical protein